MRVRVAYTATVSDDYRRAINLYYGRPGLASRADVGAWLERYGSSQDDDLMFDLSQYGKEGRFEIEDYDGHGPGPVYRFCLVDNNHTNSDGCGGLIVGRYTTRRRAERAKRRAEVGDFSD